MSTESAGPLLNPTAMYISKVANGNGHIAEHSESEFVISTNTITGLIGRLKRGGTGLIVLTGNAGHGKTHICAAVAMQCAPPGHEHSWSDVLNLLTQKGNGQQPLFNVGQRELYVIKDLSELEKPDATMRLEEAFERRNERCTIICANEGRLRNVVQASNQLTEFGNILDDVLNNRPVELTYPWLTIINLNHQSLATPASTGPSIFESLVAEWTSSEKWVVCEGCTAQKHCHIRRNVELISPTFDLPIGVNLQNLVRLAEYLGFNFTIRQMMVGIAQIMTSGLDCRSVQAGGPPGGGPEYLAWESTFSLAAQVPNNTFLRALELLDPGLASNFLMDEAVSSADFENLFPRHVTTELAADDITGTTDESPETQPLVDKYEWRKRRRRAFLSGVAGKDLDEPARSAKLLNLPYIDLFLNLVRDDVNDATRFGTLEALHSGLQAIQGVLDDKPSDRSIHLVDLSFADYSTGLGGTSLGRIGRQPTGARLLARSVDVSCTPELLTNWPDEINTIPKRIVVSCIVEEGDEGLPPLRLSYFDFEYLVSAAKGQDAHEFYSGQHLRILRVLEHWSLRGPTESAELKIFSDGQITRYVWRDKRLERRK